MQKNHKKNVVITGGDGDIAKAISELLREENYEVLVPSRKELDVCCQHSIDLFFNDITVDIIINNAGYILPSSLSDLNLEEDLKTIDINLSGVLRVTMSAIKSNPGKVTVINIGSSAGTKSRADWGAYCASKAAIIMLTECWFKEGVSAYCLSPGRTATKMRTGLFGEEDLNTLMCPRDFAKIVMLAIKHRLPMGTNIDVSINNLDELYETHN
jgi:NAD(P)-dependent dehydrogenase (short-subunit alcohol dehydrogenase family)